MVPGATHQHEVPLIQRISYHFYGLYSDQTAALWKAFSQSLSESQFPVAISIILPSRLILTSLLSPRQHVLTELAGDMIPDCLSPLGISCVSKYDFDKFRTQYFVLVKFKAKHCLLTAAVVHEMPATFNNTAQVHKQWIVANKYLHTRTHLYNLPNQVLLMDQ